jgi:hypothetical protein
MARLVERWVAKLARLDGMAKLVSQLPFPDTTWF